MRLKSLAAGSQPIPPALRHAALHLSQSSPEGRLLPQPLHEPKGPDRDERESEKCSARQEESLSSNP